MRLSKLLENPLMSYVSYIFTLLLPVSTCEEEQKQQQKPLLSSVSSPIIINSSSSSNNSNNNVAVAASSSLLLFRHRRPFLACFVSLSLVLCLTFGVLYWNYQVGILFLSNLWMTRNNL